MHANERQYNQQRPLWPFIPVRTVFVPLAKGMGAVAHTASVNCNRGNAKTHRQVCATRPSGRMPIVSYWTLIRAVETGQRAFSVRAAAATALRTAASSRSSSSADSDRISTSIAAFPAMELTEVHILRVLK